LGRIEGDKQSGGLVGAEVELTKNHVFCKSVQISFLRQLPQSHGGMRGNRVAQSEEGFSAVGKGFRALIGKKKEGTAETVQAT